MKLGAAIAEIMKREGVEILTGYPVNHLIEFAAERVTEPGEIIPAIRRAIAQTEAGVPALLEFITSKETEVSRHN